MSPIVIARSGGDSNPQQREGQDCRVAIAPRNDKWGNDNNGFVCSYQA
jgi:hypothetical protein